MTALARNLNVALIRRNTHGIDFAEFNRPQNQAIGKTSLGV